MACSGVRACVRVCVCVCVCVRACVCLCVWREGVDKKDENSRRITVHTFYHISLQCITEGFSCVLCYYCISNENLYVTHSIMIWWFHHLYFKCAFGQLKFL